MLLLCHNSDQRLASLEPEFLRVESKLVLGLEVLSNLESILGLGLVSFEQASSNSGLTGFQNPSSYSGFVS